MANYLNDRVLDFGLDILDTEANRLDICSAMPTNYTEATSTYSLGNKTSLSVGSPQDNGSNGRKVVVPAITDGVLSATGTCTHWAIVDTVNSRLLAAGTVGASQGVTNPGTFTTSSFDIYFPDAA